MFKRHGAERSGKRLRFKGGQVSVKKLNESEPLMKCRKVTCWQKHGIRNYHVITVTEGCLTGYRLTGIKVAGSLHRLLFGT